MKELRLDGLRCRLSGRGDDRRREIGQVVEWNPQWYPEINRSHLLIACSRRSGSRLWSEGRRRAELIADRLEPEPGKGSPARGDGRSFGELLTYGPHSSNLGRRPVRYHRDACRDSYQRFHCYVPSRVYFSEVSGTSIPYPRDLGLLGVRFLSIGSALGEKDSRQAASRVFYAGKSDALTGHRVFNAGLSKVFRRFNHIRRACF